MKNKLIILAVVALLLIPFGAMAQEDETTIEELYLQQTFEVQMIRSQSASQDRDAKLLALQGLRNMVNDGKVDEDNVAVIRIVENLASEGTRREVREGNTVVNQMPEVRRQATEILSEIGGPIARRALVDILLNDHEEMVLSQAVYGLGQVGEGERGEVAEAIVWVLNKENQKAAPDSNFAFASLLAIERLVEADGGVSDPALIDVLINVTASNYIRDVKLKAIALTYKFAKMDR